VSEQPGVVPLLGFTSNSKVPGAEPRGCLAACHRLQDSQFTFSAALKPQSGVEAVHKRSLLTLSRDEILYNAKLHPEVRLNSFLLLFFLRPGSAGRCETCLR